MKKILPLLLSFFVALTIEASVLKEYSTQISYLNGNMPSNFQIGQDVEISLSYDGGLLLGEPIVVNSFNFMVKDAGFDFSSSEAKSPVYNFDSDTYSVNIDGNGFDFQGQKLVGITLEYSNPDPDDGTIVITSFESYSFSGFSMSFYDESTQVITTGSMAQLSDSSRDIVIDVSSSDIEIDYNYINSFTNFILNSKEFKDDSIFLYKDGSFFSGDTIFSLENGSFNAHIVSVPEPSAYALILGALGLALAICRRRN